MSGQLSFASEINMTSGMQVSVSFHEWEGQQIVQPSSVSEMTIMYPGTQLASNIVVTDLNGTAITPAYVQESYLNDSATPVRMTLIGFTTATSAKVSLTLSDRVAVPLTSTLQISDLTSLILQSGDVLELMSGP